MKLSKPQIAAIDQANSALTAAGLPTINQCLGKQAEAVIAALTKVVEIKVKSVYGNTLIYPANEAAELIAKIAGTKTLSNQVLAYAEQLGFQIKEVPAYQLAVAA